jgi:serine/threonine-protein kinase
VTDTTDFGTASDLPVEVTVPGYRLLRPVGSDAIGIWLDAEQESLGRKVTVKVLKPEYEHHQGARREFLAEMDRLAGLDHPNLVRVIDTRREGVLALVTEHTGTRMLDGIIEAGKPTGEEVSLGHVRNVARALEYLQEQGLAHRNVTPRLVCLREGGGDRLVTFRCVLTLEDLARLKGRLAQDPSYVAPEQVGGEFAVGPKTHCYHVAAILFHLLSGHPPHGTGSPQELARAHLTQEFPSLKRYQPFLGKGIYGLVSACTQKDPDERPKLDEVADGLDELAAGRDPGISPGGAPRGIPTPRRRRRRRRR